MLQYTSTAAFVAIGGYTYLLLTVESGKKKYLVFFILEAIALLLRQNAMLMIQPMGLAVWFPQNICRPISEKETEACI